MMPMRRLLLTAFAFAFLPVLAAQGPVLPDEVRAAGDRITAGQLARDLAFLASDELRGRNTPSPGYDAAAKFIVERLEKAGVKPLGDNGGWFQRYEMHESRIDTAKTSIEIDGQTFAFGTDLVMRSYAGDVSGALPAVYVGHGWTVPDKGIDPFAALDVKGKLVIAHGPRALPNGVEVRQIGRVTPGASNVLAEAARRGAAAVIYIPQASALENWEAMARQNLTRKELIPPVPSAYAAPPATAVLVSRAVTEALFAGEQVTGPELLARGETADYPASFELRKRVTLTVTAETTVHRPYNIVGWIEGSDPLLKTEYITIESHLDGAVGTRAVEGDDIYNSADDNASGSAANLAIAEQMSTLKPKRSLIFIWDSGEEQGLWGTRHFVGNPPVPLERIVAHVNIDMIGANRAPGSPDEKDKRVTGPDEVLLIGPTVLSDKVGQLLDAVNASYQKMTFNRAWDSADSEFFYPRTDAGPFLERGILTIGFTTGIHDRYHLPADEAEALDPRKMEKIARTIFASIWALADVPERPSIDRGIPATVPRYGR
jgi:Zn-dependent M28 family amino/carboxypeptidase